MKNYYKYWNSSALGSKWHKRRLYNYTYICTHSTCTATCDQGYHFSTGESSIDRQCDAMTGEYMSINGETLAPGQHPTLPTCTRKFYFLCLLSNLNSFNYLWIPLLIANLIGKFVATEELKWAHIRQLFFIHMYMYLMWLFFSHM